MRHTTDARTTRETKRTFFTPEDLRFTHNVVMKYVKDEEEAKDATQDALLLAHRHLDDFRGDSKFTTWLYRIAATSALMHLRKRRRSPQPAPAPTEERTEPKELASTAPSPEDLVSSLETAALCDQALRSMGPKYGDVFRLRFLEGYTETEVARRLGLNVGTVKTRAHRARVRVRASLRGDTGVQAGDADMEGRFAPEAAAA